MRITFLVFSVLFALSHEAQSQEVINYRGFCDRYIAAKYVAEAGARSLDEGLILYFLYLLLGICGNDVSTKYAEVNYDQNLYEAGKNKLLSTVHEGKISGNSVYVVIIQVTKGPHL